MCTWGVHACRWSYHCTSIRDSSPAGTIRDHVHKKNSVTMGSVLLSATLWTHPCSTIAASAALPVSRNLPCRHGKEYQPEMGIRRIPASSDDLSNGAGCVQVQ